MSWRSCLQAAGRSTRKNKLISCPKLFPRYSPFTGLFGNERPVEIEMGCGKGEFLVALATEAPRRNFIGIDRARKWLNMGERKRRAHSLCNLIFLNHNANEFLREFVAPESVSTFHVNFPDPWPKNKHRQRRLMSVEFLYLMHSRLKEGGCVNTATDDEAYHAGMIKWAKYTEHLWRRIETKSGQRILPHAFPTAYEKKYIRQGKIIRYMQLECQKSPP